MIKFISAIELPSPQSVIKTDRKYAVLSLATQRSWKKCQ